MVGSQSVGEALDPVNNAVERFSSVMVLAIGSLLLFRILPDIRIRMPDFSILPALLDRAAHLAEYLTRLLVLIAVKNILLPLVFLALALKVIRPFTARLLAMTSAIDRDLKDIKQTAKEIGSEGSSALPEP